MKKIITALILVPSFVHSAELVHNFNSPSFSGVGYSSHVLTIKQLEDQQKDKNKAAAEALQAKIERDAANTPVARFLANVESRIFAQLAKQMTDSLFGEGANACTPTAANAATINYCGTINNVGGETNGSTIKWWITESTSGNMIHINVNGPGGNTTMVVPANTFFF